MISISFQSFEKACACRPEGYRKHVLSLAKIVGDRLWLTPEDHTYLANYYRSKAPQEVRMKDSAAHLAEALGRWAFAGFPVATSKVVDARKAACQKCEFWDGSARLGLGKCNHEKCGCTKLKWWLSTEKCPDGRWPEINIEEATDIDTINSDSK